MKKNNHIAFFLILWIACLQTGCTEVDLCMEEEHPHTARLTFDFDWEGNTNEKPEDMLVLMSRIINTKHYVFTINTAEGNANSEENTDDELENEFRVEGGEYSMIAFNKNTEIIDMTRIDRFEEEPAEQINDLSLSLVTFDEPDVEEMSLSYWTDFNPMYKYVKDPDVVFIGTRRINLFSGTSREIGFKPVRLTQKIRIRFRIKPDPSVTVTKIVGEMSGVVASIKLVSLQIDDSQTYRVCFIPQVVDTTDGMITYEGEINTLGIIPNINGVEMSGPGIMHLGIFAEVDGKQKVYHERINLINTLTEAQLILPMEGMTEGVRLNPDIKEKTLEIPSHLIISTEKIIPEDIGSDKWIIEKDNIIETEV